MTYAFRKGLYSPPDFCPVFEAEQGSGAAMSDGDGSVQPAQAHVTDKHGGIGGSIGGGTDEARRPEAAADVIEEGGFVQGELRLSGGTLCVVKFE